RTGKGPREMVRVSSSAAGPLCRPRSHDPAERRSDAPGASMRKLVLVGLVQEVQHIVRRLGLLEEAAEGVVTQLARDALQRPQVVAWPIGRRDEQKEQLHLLAVEAVEIDPLAADRDGAD